MAKFIYFTPEEKARAQNTDMVSLLRAQGGGSTVPSVRGAMPSALSNAKYGCGFRNRLDEGWHRLHGSRTPLRLSQIAPLPCGGSRPVRTDSRSDCGWMSAAFALACRNATNFRNIP